MKRGQLLYTLFDIFQRQSQYYLFYIDINH